MNKLKKIQIFRLAVQILMLFLLPGLYIMAFSGLKEIVKMLISGNFNFIQAIPSLVEFITVTVLSVLMGRFFCGWLCAFGTYNDLIYLASKKIFKTNFKINEKLDSYLKNIKYVVLFAIIVVSTILGSTIFSSASPWDVFAQITDFPNILISLPIGFMLLLLITVGAFFIERFFCRYLCPLGAFFTLASKVSVLKINKPTEKCGKCRICTNNCSMGLSLYKKESVRGGECINCMKCIEACPRRNTVVNAFGEDVTPALASSAAIAVFAGVYGISNLGGYIVNQYSPESSTSIVSTSLNSATQKYKDGTYTGTGTGFRGATTKVSVTISSGSISSIKTVSHGDTPNFYNRAYNVEAKEIISAQSTDVDTVSGATFSSNGIVNAVQDALSKAVVSTVADSTLSSGSTNNSTDSSAFAQASGSTASDRSIGSTSSANNNTLSNSTATSSTASSLSSNTQQGNYKDGTYTGTGTGFRGGTTKMSVTVSGGNITSISTVSTYDTPSFYSRSEKTIINRILSKQSTSVDTVSGATYSSNGIINAVKNALSKAS